MADKFYPDSKIPIRRTVELLPTVFQTDTNDKFLSGVLDPLVQPGVLDKVVGYIGRRYGKTFNGSDIYVDTDDTLRSRYQLEPGVIYKTHDKIENFYDYIDFKNQLKFFANDDERDDKITEQTHYTWNPPIDWDKFVNYREYYWVPSGPPSIPILGQSANITSTYKVVLGSTANSFIFTPDSYTNNPTLTLYRGQTYKFRINVPGQGFSIRTNFDTGSLIFIPSFGYPAGSLAVYDSKLWRAKRDISPSDGSSITIDSEDWEYLEPASSGDALEYSKGVTNNGIENGTLTFTVPYDAPDVLYYQSLITPDCFGRFIIADIEANTFINVDQEIVGKSSYTSSNGIEFSNGMVVEFKGSVSPTKYSVDTWLVEGVGRAITLTRFNDLISPVLTSDVPEILFDNAGFDTEPFDDAATYPTYKDYITIARDSLDRNPWSRYNRWFHRAVLEKSFQLRGQDFDSTEATRAKRPIVEFYANLQLFNHGASSKDTVDYLDDFTTDVFSKIEGSTGYNIDGEFLFAGARILVIADTDLLANNKIYEVEFITHQGIKQIHLRETLDTISNVGDGVLVRRGKKNGGKMFYFDGNKWSLSQQKTSVNQPPLFDIFDRNGVSFADPSTYPTSTFVGSKLLGYSKGIGKVDPELGFQLSYLNINNVGDIQFDWNFDTDIVEYVENKIIKTINISTGFFKFNPNNTYDNGWLEMNTDYLQPIIDSKVLVNDTNTIEFKTIDWSKLSDESIVNVYVNDKRYLGSYEIKGNTFTFAENIAAKSTVSLKIIADLEPIEGFYEIPIGLEKNPFNDPLKSFTLGQAIDHVTSALEFSNSLIGSIPGNSNLRDLFNFQSFGKRFIKHSGLTSLSMMLLCDKTHNIIKSIQYSKKAYTEFKSNFLAKAIEIEYNDNIIDFVDDVINNLTKTKDSNSPFYDSDMIGAGAYSKIVYVVEDTGIQTYSLSEKFDLSTLSKKAVYVYQNNQQLINDRDYIFDSTFGFVRLKVNLNSNDVIEIREYISTSTNHIPPTPTSMGLYKKYTPQKFIDDTYIEPREVIIGHDGSITAAYGDFRDELLLELELRIYNNIKAEYNRSIFDIDQILSGYYGVGAYKKSQFDYIISQEFFKWIQNTNINYTLNTYFDSQNSFTYTYSNMTDPTKTVNLPGYWRGVYQWFYDTDRPHRCPWEMLGFSQQPSWWEEQYGPAPYTKNNLILWEDLQAGVIRQGDRAGRHSRYARPNILNHIPVDGDGKLLSPLDSGLAQDFSLINNQGAFVLGDTAPVEYAWRSSSEYPFAIIIAMCLMKPFDFIADSFDRSKIVLNQLGQLVNKDSYTFTSKNDITKYSLDDPSVGLLKYLVAYIKSKGINTSTITDKINNLDVALSYRMSGFVDQQQQKFLLDSKSPAATTASIFIPPENYDIIFNISSPIANITYSGVILEKTNGGWVITGYDDINPYFYYYQAQPNSKDPLISVGGISEVFTVWIENKNYSNGSLVRYNNNYFRSLKTHNSGEFFDPANWKKLNDLPKVGAIEAYRRRVFNTLSVKKLSYGTQFTSIQQVIDFLLGYENYLISIGFVFDRYDPQNKTSQNWLSSSKEFMFWTKHNWEIGSIISLSPAAEKINLTMAVGVPDNILDGFYNYGILKGDGKPLQPQFINVNRSNQNITVETTNTSDGIYYLKLYYVLKEHVTIFDDRTVFNDIIYDKTTGYRQGRIKVQGFRTTDWDGDYTSPGFIFDNVNIQTWQPYKDYKLGDIVTYKAYNWVSLQNQLGSEFFDDNVWSKLDSTPTKSLIPNFDYKINQFYDYFDVSSEGVSQSQRDLARHTVGYQSRNYLQNLAEDPITQFQLYQGFIKEKGTNNSITKIFGKLSRSGSDSIELNEEWAFLLGRLGGTDQLTEVEIQLERNKFEINPQVFLIEENESLIDIDQNYRLTISDFTIPTIPYSVDINTMSFETEPTFTAGYVSIGQYELVIQNIEDLINLDINTVNENDHIWITFYKDSWTVFRLNELSLLSLEGVNRLSTTSVEIKFNRRHNFAVNDYVGFRDIINLVGFFKIISISNVAITIEVSSTSLDPELDSSTTTRPHAFTECRFDSYSNISQGLAALYFNGSKIFVDDNGENLWEVVEKQKQYSAKFLSDYGTSTPLRTGEKVIYDNINKHVITGVPGSGLVLVYAESLTGLQLKQIVSPPTGFFNNVLGSFGSKMAISPDSKYLIVGAPLASGITSNYKGEWEPSKFYEPEDIVLYGGRLWKAKNANSALPDGSTELAINTDDWELAEIIPALTSGNAEGYYQQGIISIYEYANGSYTISQTFISPRPADNEFFGSEISISKSGNSYYLSVSATGSYNNTGRVYLYKYENSTWKHLENIRYKGIYDPLASYYSGDIVWQAAQDPEAEGVRGNLWTSLEDSTADGSTLSMDNSGWVKIGKISTHCSLPTNVALEDDGSTLEFAYTGLLSNDQIAELIKAGDKFGTSMAMNSDGSILVIGAPEADGQFFANYRGMWRPDVEYIEGEVVRYVSSVEGAPITEYQYYKLEGFSIAADSTYRSYNENPSDSSVWVEVGDSTTSPSGKIFVYIRDANDVYTLTQMINASSISSFSDIDSGLVISTGDQFGFSMDIDASGNNLVVSSPKSDISFQDQGSVYVLSLDDNLTEFRVKQKLESFEQYPNEYFGYGVSISPDGTKIAVGARNTSSNLSVYFDLLLGTTFDKSATTFSYPQGYTGGVYVFDKKDQVFFLTEKLQEVLAPDESFGFSVDCVGSYIAVGSPFYRLPVAHASGVIAYEGEYVGNVRLFKKDPTVSSWNTLTTRESVVDIRKIQSIELYDNVNNVKIQDVDYVDSAKGKILNVAEQEIKFKTPYDPAIYNFGTEDVVVDTSIPWYEKNVGKLWWNIGNAKWLYAEQKDYAYRTGNWNQLAFGSSIDVCEWVETSLLPSEWAALADTNEGLALGISGQPLYPNNNIYSQKQFFSKTTGLVNETKYYYWVANKALIPSNMPGRTKSAAEVAGIINNPAGSGIAFIAMIDSDKFLTYNFQSVISSDTALLNIKYRKNLKQLNSIHNEYQLLTEGIPDSLPADKLERKWIDSLVGFDVMGNRVPDTNLSEKQKYGINFRPRQGMFVDRIAAVKLFTERANNVLLKEPFVDTIDFTNLNSKDEIPAEVLNLYDTVVETDTDLFTVGTVRTKRAVLRANLLNGELDTIDIVDSGFGYKPKELFNQEIPGVYLGPPISIQGDGINASAECHIDGQGRIITVVVTNRGKKYSTINATVRYFSVLVRSDSKIDNFWSIYSWDDIRKVFFRSQSQAFDTTRYWNYSDWWLTGYGQNTRITIELNTVFDEDTMQTVEDDLIRIKEYGSGGWAVFRKIANSGADFFSRWTLVGRQNGTIQLSTALYDTTIYGIGFDNDKSFDDTDYDVDNSKEFRNIIKALKEDIFVGDYSVEWNNSFFSSIRYVLAEQQYVDWVFKTSFLNATHNIGSFETKTNYKNDNLESYQEYINEVKPFRTTIREYISRYDNIEEYQSSETDFDLPPAYSKTDGTIISIDENRPEINQYPWKYWADNKGFSIIAIEIYDSGSEYRTPPKVLIDGNGTGATAKAYVSNGRVSGIEVLTPGEKYTKAPTITLVGGNPSTARQAKAVAIIGESKIRSFNLGIKFDRVNKNSDYQTPSKNQIIFANGRSAVFELNYAPTRDKTKITIFKNNKVVLSNEYNISFYYSSLDTYSRLRGKLSFNVAPADGDIISVSYEINDLLLSAVDRINKYYSPTAGMIGNELNQLMTGIDFGGVQIQGTTFDVTGGWDALPWFTDNWDSVEASSDYYHVCDGSTTQVELPFTPAQGQEINIYLKRTGTNTSVRIDDPSYTTSWDSSVAVNPNAEMPTFIGDGINRSVIIGIYIQTESGDILIFRPIESDGSVTITDENLLDTKLSGGSLSVIDSIYQTATGSTPEEIMISGGKFIEPDHVPAPEENIPGQVLDSVSIKIYQSRISGAAPLQSKISFGDGTTLFFPIGQKILENNAVFVYVDKIKKNFGVDYALNLIEYNVEFFTPPPSGTLIEIISIGLGGLGILDYQEFIADGTTNLFLTNANYQESSSVFVTVNGDQVDAAFKDSTGIVDTTDRTLIELAFYPDENDIIKIVVLQSSSDVDSNQIPIIKVNTQTIWFEGSTRNFDLEYFVELERGSARNSMIVELDGRVLKGSDTSYAVYDGTNNVFTLGIDPLESAGSILPSNIRVFINNILRTIFTDYVFDGATKVLTIYSSVLSIGDIIKVQNDLRSEYRIVGGNLIIDPSVPMTVLDETDNVRIDVTWFSEYPSFDIISDQKSGGKVHYQLSRPPISSSYVWVYKNGMRLTQEKEYYVSVPRNVVYLNVESTPADDIKTITFTNDIYELPSAYEIHKDMLNTYRYTRFSKGDVSLTSDLMYYDNIINVNDSSSLGVPYPSRNLPGIIWIDGERIEYMSKIGNVLSQLRRGTHGTAIKEIHAANSQVVDVGYEEIIPYNESQGKVDLIYQGSLSFVYDGSTGFEIETDIQIGLGIKENLIVKIDGIEILPEYYTITKFAVGGLVNIIGPAATRLATNSIVSVESLLVGPLDFIPIAADKARWYSSRTYVDKGTWSALVSYTLRNVVLYGNYYYTNLAVCKGSSYAPIIDGEINSNFWERITIPTDYGPCDQIEVFAGGRRLKKDAQAIWFENGGPYSPDADIVQEAEFSVDGTTGFIRLTKSLAAGSRVTIITRTGKTWYERGATTATSGKSLLDNDNSIARFIAEKHTSLPE